MNPFERYLTVWVTLCIVIGIALGHFFPGAFHVIASAEVAQVNLPVAILIWLMILPMLLTGLLRLWLRQTVRDRAVLPLYLAHRAVLSMRL